jgi:peptidoglycan/xylan/chitin deacetylase (PgdA/CDA1 family)
MQSSVYWLLGLNVAGKVAAWLLFARAPWVAVTGWVVTDVLVLYHLLVPGAQGFGRVYRSFETPDREVWLTLDDGPDPEDTPRVLALLAEYGARATFFVIGEHAERHPELIRAIQAGGHEIAHHTHTHPLASFWCATPARLRRELRPALEVLGALGVRPRWFRSPAGLNNFWLAKELQACDLARVGWSVRGLEYSSWDAQEVVERVAQRVVPGSIILMHEGPRMPGEVRLNALRGVLERLRATGYACVLPEATQLRCAPALAR